MKLSAKVAASILIFTFVLSLFAFPVTAQAATPGPQPNLQQYRRNLQYGLAYDKKTNEANFTVKNSSYLPLYLSFPTAKKFDLAVYNQRGTKVWQLSQDKQYTQAVSWEWFYPGETKSYKSELPQLAPGKYTLVAFYSARGINTAVTSLNITVQEEKKANPALSYDAWYSGGKDHKIVLAVRNLTKSPVRVEFPGGLRYDVQLKGNNGFTWCYSAGKAATAAITSDVLKAGLNRFHYIYLPDLPKGRYSAQVYYLGHSSRIPVETLSFTVN